MQSKKSVKDAQFQLLVTEAVYTANVPIHNKKGNGIYSKYFAKKVRFIRGFFATEKPETLYDKLRARKKAQKKKKS